MSVETRLMVTDQAIMGVAKSITITFRAQVSVDVRTPMGMDTITGGGPLQTTIQTGFLGVISRISTGMAMGMLTRTSSRRGATRIEFQGVIARIGANLGTIPATRAPETIGRLELSDEVLDLAVIIETGNFSQLVWATKSVLRWYDESILKI